MAPTNSPGQPSTSSPPMAQTTPYIVILTSGDKMMSVWTLYGHKPHPDNRKLPQMTIVCNRKNSS
jgi:hypothetical protein